MAVRLDEAEMTTLARLGMVLYWLGCGVACLCFIGALVSIGFGLANWTQNGPPGLFFGVVFAIAGVLSWLTGRACKYILAGV
jgi:hypothetical protein